MRLTELERITTTYIVFGVLWLWFLDYTIARNQIAGEKIPKLSPEQKIMTVVLWPVFVIIFAITVVKQLIKKK